MRTSGSGLDTPAAKAAGFLLHPPPPSEALHNVAPITTKGRPYPSRVPCQFDGKDGHIVLDQLRTVDKTRLVKTLGTIDAGTQRSVLAKLSAMFAP